MIKRRVEGLKAKFHVEQGYKRYTQKPQADCMNGGRPRSAMQGVP